MSKKLSSYQKLKKDIEEYKQIVQSLREDVRCLVLHTDFLREDGIRARVRLEDNFEKIVFGSPMILPKDRVAYIGKPTKTRGGIFNVMKKAK